MFVFLVDVRNVFVMYAYSTNFPVNVKKNENLKIAAKKLFCFLIKKGSIYIIFVFFPNCVFYTSCH